MKYGFVIDNRKCIGCHACTVACKAEHLVPLGVNRTWVKYVEKGEFPNTRRLFSVMRCNHCDDAPCVEICPVSALFTRSDGIVDFDNRRCISCKACTQACPYDAIYIDPNNYTAAKCNYCTHRVDIGLEPACVIVCPEHAIIAGDMDDPNTEISKLLARETVSVRKPEKGTKPKLYYIDGDRTSLDPTETYQQADYMWSSQAYGVGKYAKFVEKRISSSALKHEKKEEKGVDGKARRVYDAPDKGILWGWEVSAYVLTKAIAAGAFLLPFSTGFFIDIPKELKLLGLIVSFIFISITGLLLIKDLGRPDRFLYVLLRPQWKSWLTRGAYIITSFGGVLTLLLAVFLLGFENFSALKVVEFIGVVLALLSAVYTAFLFAQAKGRDFWQSPMLGLHMMTHSIMAGLAVFLVASYFIQFAEDLKKGLVYLTILTIVLHLILLTVELLTSHTTKDAEATVKMILYGEFKTRFWLGMILLGNIIPLFLVNVASDLSLALTGLFIIVGMWFAEDIWVKAPQKLPLS
ncbi:MAG: NrfD/PsrC family molybdoenzyme membrane anchor subunit [Acidobacteriota bacterium]|nr:polysulfide reductase NrfD [Pyrinomonadaceae bacterium]MDW8303652.1 NrfD/PsrC family molybdoenzyme membrane anchor subunit [Acidobacteriota bacterium]